MWKKVNGKLIHVTDQERVKFRTNISKKILDKLREVAEEHHTHVNYLLESGLKETIKLKKITYDKEKRPKDRVQYKTTYDRELLEKMRAFASQNSIFINDLIEYSVQFISIENSKTREYRHRIERKENNNDKFFINDKSFLE